MNDSDTAGTVAGRRELETDLCARMGRLEKSNARLRVGLVGALMLGGGLVLGGQAQKSKDSVIAHVGTDGTIYRLYESGRIDYLRVEDDPPRTAEGVFDWGVVRIDDRYELSDRP